MARSSRAMSSAMSRRRWRAVRSRAGPLRRGAKRIVLHYDPSSTGWRPRRKRRLNGNGGNVSKASQFVSTSRPIPHRVLVDDELRHRAPRVVADEHHIAQIESSQEVEHDSCDTPRRQVSVRLHRNGVGRQRPRRGERGKPRRPIARAHRPTTRGRRGIRGRTRLVARRLGPRPGSGSCRPRGRRCGVRRFVAQTSESFRSSRESGQGGSA